MVDCDFCGDRRAILYCRADSAKLCLSCDHHVHSANGLSRKHVRSQICDNCAAEPAASRCATDGLVLCQDCDWDAHGVCAASAAHDRSQVEGFSGVPSAFALASSWGLEIEEKGVAACEWDGLLEELMVPNANPAAFAACGGELAAGKRSPTCGKQKQAILKQLLELLADGDGAGDDGSAADGEDEERHPPLMQPTTAGGFTSLLMIQQTPKNKASIDTNKTQIWDFNLGRLRGQDDSSAMEMEEYGTDHLSQHYGEILKEASLAKRRGLLSSNQNSSFIHGPATSESNNRSLSSSSVLEKNRSLGDFHFMDQSIPFRSNEVAAAAAAAAMTREDIETLAKNRGNAMQRYKEKKKTRRY
ncbi:hypothetical protein M569_14629, partial [Genlisea aurea]